MATRATLESAYEIGRRAHSDLPPLPFDLFVAHFAGRLPNAPDLHWDDLYLALHCAHGTDAAWRKLARTCGAVIGTYARRLDPTISDPDQFRDGLFADLCQPAGDGTRPRIASYDGRGRLIGWLAAVTYRRVVDRARRRKAAQAVQETLARETAPADPPPPQAAIHAEWDRFLRQAVPRAFAALPIRERAILRLHYFGGLEQKAAARLHGLSEWQLSRMLKRAYRQIREHLEQEAAVAMAAQPAELAGLRDLMAGHVASFFEGQQ